MQCLFQEKSSTKNWSRKWWKWFRWKIKWLNLTNYHAINLLIELTNVLHMLCLCYSDMIFVEILIKLCKARQWNFTDLSHLNSFLAKFWYLKHSIVKFVHIVACLAFNSVVHVHMTGSSGSGVCAMDFSHINMRYV